MRCSGCAQVRHREAGFHTLLQALQQRMQLLELHLIEAQKAAGLPISIPAAPAIPPATLGLLSVGFVESTMSDMDLAQLSDMSQTDSLMHCQIKEEFDKVTPSKPEIILKKNLIKSFKKEFTKLFKNSCLKIIKYQQKSTKIFKILLLKNALKSKIIRINLEKSIIFLQKSPKIFQN